MRKQSEWCFNNPFRLLLYLRGNTESVWSHTYVPTASPSCSGACNTLFLSEMSEAYKIQKHALNHTKHSVLINHRRIFWKNCIKRVASFLIHYWSDICMGCFRLGGALAAYVERAKKHLPSGIHLADEYKYCQWEIRSALYGWY